jgi:hypothetical protein
VSKEVLSQRTNDYRDWVEAYARNHKTPMEWAEKGTRKEDYVLPALRRLEKKNAYGVYFIFKSMEQGRTFRISVPKFPTQDPNHRILAHQRSRFTHYYFYIRDAVLGPIIVRVASFFPFHATYWLNGHCFIEQELKRKQIGFRKNDNAFLAVDNAAELQAAADRLSTEIIGKQLDYWTFLLGSKFSKKERSQTNLSRFYAIAQIEYCRNFIFKGHFPIHKIFERSCEFGLWRLTAHRISEFPLLQPLALPVAIGTVRYPGIKIHELGIIRLMEVLMHGGTTVGGWTAKQIHQAVLTTFELSAKTYGLNQLRYDLRKLKGHGLLERDGRGYACLPPQYQRRPGGVAIPVLPQTPLRSLGK